MFLDDSLKILRRNVFVVVSLYKILHHRRKTFVTGLHIPHHHSQHVKNERSFTIEDRGSGTTGPG